MPRAVTVEPPSAVTLPPPVAVVAEMAEMASVVTVGIAETVTVTGVRTALGQPPSPFITACVWVINAVAIFVADASLISPPLVPAYSR